MNLLDMAIAFTETYQRYEHDHPARREAQCLKTQYPAILGEIRPGDLFAGRIVWPAVGFRFFSQPGFMGYYCNTAMIQTELDRNTLSPAQHQQWLDIRQYWKHRTTVSRIEDENARSMPATATESIKYEDPQNTPIVAVYTYRASGINLDFSKLLKLGIAGLKKDVQDHARSTAASTNNVKLYEGMLICLDVLSAACRFYASQAGEKAARATEGQGKVELVTLGQTLENIALNPPKTLHEAIQLFWLYARLANVDNFGRLDVYLADYYAADQESRRLDDPRALVMLQNLWRLITDDVPEWSGRIFIGGYGRPREQAADRLALLAMEASRTVRKVVPQLSLRLYQGMNSDVFSKALDVIGEGCVFPMLYNDDVNIPAFQNIFNVNREEAEQYIVSDCGEFGLNHRSIGFPDGTFNMAKVLELTLHNGRDPVSGKPMGLQTGPCSELTIFAALWNAYTRQTEYFIGLLMDRLAPMYRILEDDSCALFAAMLTDDCIKKGLGFFRGVRLKGLLVEIYGTISVADSLAAIQQAVFENKTFSLEQLVQMLDANFTGFEKERRILMQAPKYGNDDSPADDMAVKVYQHICATLQAQRKRLSVDFCLADLINAGGHVPLGKLCGALPDGRLATRPLSNANNPSNGNDRQGVTALLNSLVKLNPAAIGGQVQYLKFSRELFSRSRPKLEALLKTYFNNGGSQAMITVVNRNDLENALKEPEKYGDLIVRVGGFCAKFISLSRELQEEIIARTLQN